MPVVNGLEATHLLSESRLSCKVIMLSMFDDYLFEAIEVGARGYLIKGMKRGELAQAISKHCRFFLLFSDTLATL